MDVQKIVYHLRGTEVRTNRGWVRLALYVIVLYMKMRIMIWHDIAVGKNRKISTLSNENSPPPVRLSVVRLSHNHLHRDPCTPRIMYPLCPLSECSLFSFSLLLSLTPICFSSPPFPSLLPSQLFAPLLLSTLLSSSPSFKSISPSPGRSDSCESVLPASPLVGVGISQRPRHQLVPVLMEGFPADAWEMTPFCW